MSLEITNVDDARALRRFTGLPGELYRDEPGFVAPLRMDRKGLLDPAKAPFFRTGKARYWLALRDGRPVGRISAQIAQKLPLGMSDGHGQIGALDAADDGEAIAALLETAETWLVAQGCTGAFGPCTLDMNGEPGLMVSGQDEPAMTMTQWHPQWLLEPMLRAGYVPVKDLHSWRLDHDSADMARIGGAAKRNAADMGLTARGLDMKNLGRELELICAIWNDAWSENWGFLPLDPRDLESVEKELKPFMTSDAGIIVERDGKIMGVILLIPNMFEITCGLGTDPSPLGWLKLGLRSLRPRFRSGRVILMGVSGIARGSVGGAAIAMTLVDEVLTRFSAHPWTHIEAGWVLEDNTALVRLLEYAGFRRNKTFRLFEKPLGTAPVPNRGDAT